MNRHKTLAFTMFEFMMVIALLLAVGCRTNETPENQVTDAKILTDVKAKLAEGNRALQSCTPNSWKTNMARQP